MPFADTQEIVDKAQAEWKTGTDALGQALASLGQAVNPIFTRLNQYHKLSETLELQIEGMRPLGEENAQLKNLLRERDSRIEQLITQVKDLQNQLASYADHPDVKKAEVARLAAQKAAIEKRLAELQR